MPVTPLAVATAQLPVTEDSLALVFANEFSDRARFDHHSGRWYLWDGSIWRKNEDLAALEWCRGLCRTAAAMDGKAAAKLGKHATVLGVEKLARSDRRIAVTSEKFDRDPMLLGTPGGTVDLRDGALRPAKQDDYITRQAAVAPADEGSRPERWLQFLDEATAGDQGYIDYLQEIAGYALTGKTNEHALFFIYGPGGNGKSVFLNVLRGILGDYAVTSPIETFMASRSPQHSTDVAMMKGARLVTASETDSGRQWAEAKVKQLTGGDKVAARFMRQDNFEFTPQFKLVIAGNHKPALRSVDDANKRRFRLLPFTVKPEAPDPALEEKIRKEWPAVLRWMIDGCIQWQAEGLRAPDKVTAATAQYFEDQDSLGQWLAECCEVNDQGLIDTGCTSAMLCGKSSSLFGSWKKWCDDGGETPGSNKSFSEQLMRLGFQKKRSKNGIVFYGLALKPDNRDDRYG